jgi:hypothetical protein
MNEETDRYKRHWNNYTYVDGQLIYMKHVGTEFYLHAFIALWLIKRVYTG